MATSVALGPETLYGVIGAVAQGPDLERVLPAVVGLLADATACHACFIYLREGDRLRMRAASPVFQHAVGRVTLGLDEGLCGWVARRRAPAFIRENALADPRMKYVPELEEERFQSMCAVPLLDRADEVIGVVVLHTQAPREFDREVLDFLVGVAALVAGAIDNARLYEEARRRVAALSALAALGQAIAAETGRDALLRVACEGVRELLAGAACRVHLLDERGRLELAALPGARTLAASLTAGGEELGVLVAERDAPFAPEDQGLLEAVANQLAVALQKADLIERLTEENIVRDLFDALADGRAAAAESRARAAGHDLSRPHVVAVLEPLNGGVPDWAHIEARLRRALPGALCDPGTNALRALLPADRLDRLDAELDRLAREECVVAGRSAPRRGLGDDRQSLAEAATAAGVLHALAPEGGARAYDALGAYRYLARLAAEHPPDPRHAAAIAALADYDRRRRTQLVATLERHLDDRGALAATARALFVHPNTLRQRLERIEAVSGLVLAEEDLLSLELALKLARLRAWPERPREGREDWTGWT